jgi:hypothetical protein
MRIMGDSDLVYYLMIDSEYKVTAISRSLVAKI